MTDRCRAQADVWREVMALSDEQLAGAIRRDGIDILVDLAMHTAGNRLLVFARKPAPVQATYLAYCGKTGLRTIDYRLTDPYLDPPVENEAKNVSPPSEQPIRLPETYWCYRPAGPDPAGKRLARRQGRPSNLWVSEQLLQGDAADAGRLVRFAAGHARVATAAARPPRQPPRSRAGVSRRARCRADRVTFVGMVPREDYFRIYEQMHVALDPFPYGGGTTTCDALWMGVPVVSLAGQTSVGRSGLSILSSAGLPELVAKDAQQYTRIAVELAGDLPRLRRLRATLRDRLRSSPLMDASRLARHVEAAYRAMWQRWCAG